MGAFSEGAMKGFALMDNYYDRQDARKDREATKRMNERLMTLKEAEHTSGLKTAGLQQEAAQLTLNKAYDDEAAKQYVNIRYDENGNKRTPSTPEEMKQMQSRLVDLINTSPRFKDVRGYLAQNPNVDPNRPLSNLIPVFDRQAKQPIVFTELNMKDGNKAMLSKRRSSDADDPYTVLSVDQIDGIVEPLIGDLIGAKTTPAEARANQAEIAKEERKFKHDLALQNAKRGNHKILKTTDENGNEVFLRYDDESDEMIPVQRGNTGASRISLDDALPMARREAEDVAGLLRTDQEDFGGSREKWINERALEIAGAPKPADADALPVGMTQRFADAMPTGKYIRVGNRIFAKDENGKVYDLGTADGARTLHPKAVELLKSDPSPDARKEFDAVYGNGSAASVLDDGVATKRKPAVTPTLSDVDTPKAVRESNPARAMDTRRAVALMEERRRKGRSVTKKEHLEAAQMGFDAAQRVEKARTIGLEHRMSLDDLELAIASGKLSAATEASARRIVSIATQTAQ